MRNLLGALLIALSLAGPVTLLGGCAALGGASEEAYTPRQQFFDIATKYEAIQVVAAAVVTDPNTPAGVKRGIQVADLAATTAIENYAEAVKENKPGWTSYLSAAFDAVQQMIVKLAEGGYFKEKQA